MKGQVSLITGATEGVGKTTAIEFVRKGYTVVIAARNEAKAEMVIKEIAATTGNNSADYMIADLKSLRQIDQLAGSFRLREVTFR